MARLLELSETKNNATATLSVVYRWMQVKMKEPRMRMLDTNAILTILMDDWSEVKADIECSCNGSVRFGSWLCQDCEALT